MYMQRNKKGQFAKGYKYRLGAKHTQKAKKKISKTRIERGLAKGKDNPMFGRHHSEKSKEQIRQKKIGIYIGEKSGNWKGGITPINQIIRTSLEYKLWRKAVFERDNWTCVWCGYRSRGSKDIHADHIKRFSDYPELRFAIDNGRTLCILCHKTTDTWGNKKGNKIINLN